MKHWKNPLLDIGWVHALVIGLVCLVFLAAAYIPELVETGIEKPYWAAVIGSSGTHSPHNTNLMH